MLFISVLIVLLMCCGVDMTYPDIPIGSGMCFDGGSSFLPIMPALPPVDSFVSVNSVPSIVPMLPIAVTPSVPPIASISLDPMSSLVDGEFLGDVTPVSKVNRLVQHNKMKQEYAVVEKTGPSHNPKFTVALRIFNDRGELFEEHLGTGGRIKEAKQAAAAVALAESNMSTLPLKRKRRSYLSIDSLLQDNEKHPVSVLNEISQKLQSPINWNIDEQGPQHLRVYSAHCAFNEHESFGKGQSKKASKKAAAAQMISILKRANSLESTRVVQKKKKNKKRTNKKSKVKDECSQHGTSQFLKLINKNKYPSNKLEAFDYSDDQFVPIEGFSEKIERFIDAKNPYTDDFEEIDNKVDTETDSDDQVLGTLAAGLGYKVDFDNYENNGEHVSVVTLKSHSKIHCYGKEIDPKKAKELSIKAALSYLPRTGTLTSHHRTVGDQLGNSLASTKRYLKSMMRSLQSTLSPKMLAKYSLELSKF